MPSLRASTFAALGGTEKCCHTPGKSVKRRSIICTFSSRIAFTISSAVAHFGNMVSLLSWRTASWKSCYRSRRYQVVCDGYSSTLCVAAPAASALVRTAHQLHRVFDMPPGSGQFGLAFCFKLDGVLGSFRNGLGAMCFQQLPRIFVDFDFSHGVMLLSFWAQPGVPVELRAVDVDTSSSAHSVHP